MDDPPPTNAELARSVTGVLTACVKFRRCFSRATPRQQEAVMAGWPWRKSALELVDMKAWVAVTHAELQAVSDEQQHQAPVVERLRSVG